jgi:ribosomal protein S27AE
VSQPGARLDALEVAVADLRAALRVAGVEVPRRRLARRRKRCAACGVELVGHRNRLACSVACRNRRYRERGVRLERLETEVADLRAALALMADAARQKEAAP